MEPPRHAARAVQCAARSPEHLLHQLAEAAELEHSLLCSYLYAAFGLKSADDASLTTAEADAVRRWRDDVMAVSMEEMSHLAQVANLMVAMGARPHFDRPNLPVAPGYHPADIHVSLRPFDFDTLDHFIFLERPDDAPVTDAAAPTADAASPAREGGSDGTLTPSGIDYATIGEFYAILGAGFEALARDIGEQGLFIGPAHHQLRPEEIGIDGLSVVCDLASARRALDLIVVQGEGGNGSAESSHFSCFNAIRDEYVALLAANPSFVPSRPVAANPVMRPPTSADRTHVTAAAAAAVLDACNAVYSLMLRSLAAVYETPWQDVRRPDLLASATTAMRVLSTLADALSALPASDEPDAPNAGVSFAMPRHTEGLAPGVDAVAVLARSWRAVERRLPALTIADPNRAKLATSFDSLRSRPGFGSSR